jgi:hypothetical protein
LRAGARGPASSHPRVAPRFELRACKHDRFFLEASKARRRRNIQRCVALLATELTELERRYLRKWIAEERAELERLQGGLNQIKQEQLSPQSPVNKKAYAEDMPAYAPTDKEREIVETAEQFERAAAAGATDLILCASVGCPRSLDYPAAR